MSIKRKFELIFSGLLASTVLSCASIIWAIWSIDDVSRIENRRLESLQLADELRQSSDDLTRMARSFAATRDGVFELYFQEILDIRAGEIPYPEGYDGIFWDFMIPTDGRLAYEGDAVSLKQRMEHLGFSDQEFAKLREAEENSNDLVNLEAVAMNAIKGQFDDGTGEFIKFGTPDQRLALNLLFGEEYHLAKAKIMAPIQEFFDLLEERTSQEIDAVRQRSDHITQFAFFTVFLTLGLIVYAFVMMRRSVISPLGELRDAVGMFRLTRESVDLTHLGTKDEIGRIAKGLTDTTRDVSSYISGARFELFVTCDGEVDVTKGTKKGLGYRGTPYGQEFEDKTVSLQPGQSFYLTTDGLVDQVGGERRRMYGKKRLKELLLSMSDLSMEDQKEKISEALREFQGNETRRDDVSVIGFIL